MYCIVHTVCCSELQFGYCSSLLFEWIKVFGLFRYFYVTLALMFKIIRGCCFGLLGLLFSLVVLDLFGYCPGFVQVIVGALFTAIVV
jgi:hypothetical protein